MDKISSQAQKVLDFIRKKRLVSRGETLVVAVSGGPDSVCLLYILSELRNELGIDLHIAHLNHQLRGKDSVADAAYVAGLARRLRLPATIESRDVNAYRKEKRISLEEAAREVRYAYLTEVVQTVGAVRVAVGHTADDHIETVLMHFIRGSGTRGLRGLLPSTPWKSAAGDITIIRPLLELSREETAAYCRQHKLRPRTDTSNFSTDLFRNRVRLDLLPVLKKYNPQIAGALLRTAAIAANDLDFIDKEVDRLFNEVVSEENDAVIIAKRGFLKSPTALQRYLLRRSIESLLGSLKDIESVHIEDLLNALDKPAGKVIGLPFGLNFTIEYDSFVLARDSASLCPFPPLEKETVLSIPGMTCLSGWNIEAAIVSPYEVKTVKGKNAGFTANLDFSGTGRVLAVHSRRPGDRFQPLGLGSVKKLNGFMIDAHIPRDWRRRIPIVASPERIIWVVGYRIDERVKVTDKTLTVLRLEFKRV